MEGRLGERQRIRSGDAVSHLYNTEIILWKISTIFVRGLTSSLYVVEEGREEERLGLVENRRDYVLDCGLAVWNVAQ